MLTPEQLIEIEAACDQCSAGFGQQRADAERFVVALRGADNAIEMAHFIIGHSKNDNACFHAAVMMKEAALRNWHTTAPEERSKIKANLLQHVLQRGASLKRFVRQPLLQVVAILVKRGWFEEDPAVFSEFMRHVQRLLEDSNTRSVGALMMLALLEEFSSSSRSVVGLSWEFHNQCQQRFLAEGHLKTFFCLSLNLLGGAVETLRAQPSQQDIDKLLGDAGELVWVSTCVSVVNQTLNWDFSGSASSSSGVVGLASLAPNGGRADVIAPGQGWSDVLVQQSTLDLIYALYAVCRFSSNGTISHACRQSLVDMAAIKGDVFPDENARSAYLDYTLQSVLNLMSAVSESEYVDVALILLRLITNFGPSAVMRSPRAKDQLEALGELTCLLMQVSSTSDEASVEEALDHLLEGWSTLAVDLQVKEERDMLDALAPYTGKVVRAFIDKCLRDAVKEVEEWDAADEEHEDKSVLEERLNYVGCIARPNLNDALPLLGRLITERTEALRAVLVQGACLQQNQTTLALEQLYWLVSIAGRCVADEGEGEIPMVPDAVAILSSASAARQEADPLVVLVNQIVETIKVLDSSKEANKEDLVSPVLIETMARFLTRLSQSYLLPEVSDKYQLSPSLSSLFGASEHGGGVESVLSFIVERAMIWLNVWSSEEEVMSATTQLLLSLASRKIVAKMLLANAAWLNFSRSITLQLSRDAGVRQIPLSSLSLVMQALCASISGIGVGDDQRHATSTSLRELIGPVVQRTGALLQHGHSATDLTLRAVCLLHGACKSADFYTYDAIFDLVAPVLEALPAALEASREHSDFTAAIVQLYVVVGEVHVSYLSAHQMSFFNRCCLQLLQTFGRVSAGISVSPLGSSDGAQKLSVESNFEWLREHVLALLQLLLHLARKDVADFSFDGHQGQEGMDVGDVVVYGISLIQPLITPEALGFPALAREYFAFLSWLCETYPNKVSMMQQQTLDPIIACLLHGISFAAEPEVARKSVEALDALACYTINHPSAVQILDKYPLLQSLLDMLLFKQFDPAVLDASCDALLSLVSSQRLRFEQLMGQVVAGQVMDNQRRRVSEATSALLAQVSTSDGAAATGPQKREFRRHVRAFLGSVRPFLVTI